MDTAKTIYECYKLVESLSEGERLRFYELFSLQLTVAIRIVITDSLIGDRDKLRKVDLINEILHRSTAKIPVMRLGTHAWTEHSFWEMIAGYVSLDQAICPLVKQATKEALNVARLPV